MIFMDLALKTQKGALADRVLLFAPGPSQLSEALSETTLGGFFR
jgi:hypothetical protein